MTTTRLPLDLCPFCGYAMDRATVLDKSGRKPKPGNMSLCLDCGGFLVFQDNLKVRAATIDDALALDTRALATLYAGQRIIRDRGRLPKRKGEA